MQREPMMIELPAEILAKLLDGGEAFVKTSLLNFATGDLGLRITKFGSKALFGGLSFGVKRLDRTPVLLFGFDELLMMKR